MTGSRQRLCHPSSSTSQDRASPSPRFPYLLAAHVGDDGTQGYIFGFDLPRHRDHPLQRLLVEGSLLVLEVLALKVVDLQEQSEGAVDELRHPFHLGGEGQQAGVVSGGSPSCLAASGKTFCFPVAVDFQYWLVTTGLGAGDMRMTGSEPADVDRLGLHRWVLPGEGEALGQSQYKAVCDNCPGLSSVCARAPARGQLQEKGVVFG